MQKILCTGGAFMKKIPVWIDTDCGVDDAIALLCATRLDNIEIVGASAGVGTVDLGNTFRNTRDVLCLAGRKDVPVYPGAASSWIEPYRPAPQFHGENGLGNCEIPHSDAPLLQEHAWDKMKEAADRYEGELIIVTLGQLTDLATAIVKYPSFSRKIKALYMMGGAVDGGNTTMCAEANVVRDPEAAQCVFKSGIPIVMFGLDVTEKVYFDRDDLDKIALKDSEVCRLVRESTKIAIETNRRSVRGDIYNLHDVCPVLYLKYPELFQGKQAGVYVETGGRITRGKTISDLYVLSDKKLPAKNTYVITEADREKLAKITVEILLSY